VTYVPEKAKLYSKRLLQPYVGVVQIADFDWARALTLDGVNWSIRYTNNENKTTRHARYSHDPRVNLTMIVNTEGDQPKMRVIRRHSSNEKLLSDSQRMFDVLKHSQIPFRAADNYEYWLLDNNDDSPVALLHSCLHADHMSLPVPPAEWLSIPAAELSIPYPDVNESSDYRLPVNAYLQQIIEDCAGTKPKTAWFNRRIDSDTYFPPCLIRDNWDSPQNQQISELYLNRIAPRLLMIDGLSHAVRQYLEKKASKYAFDVDTFFPLYPEVLDKRFLKAARVEARLRRTNNDKKILS